MQYILYIVTKSICFFTWAINVIESLIEIRILPFLNIHPYRHIIGKLNCCSNTNSSYINTLEEYE